MTTKCFISSQEIDFYSYQHEIMLPYSLVTRIDTLEHRSSHRHTTKRLPTNWQFCGHCQTYGGSNVSYNTPPRVNELLLAHCQNIVTSYWPDQNKQLFWTLWLSSCRIYELLKFSPKYSLFYFEEFSLRTRCQKTHRWQIFISWTLSETNPLDSAERNATTHW